MQVDSLQSSHEAASCYTLHSRLLRSCNVKQAGRGWSRPLNLLSREVLSHVCDTEEEKFYYLEEKKRLRGQNLNCWNKILILIAGLIFWAVFVDIFGLI